MTGVTPHGIRHPDGASRAKNLGPELQQMAEDLDALIYQGLGPIAEEIVEQEVTEQLAGSQAVIDAAAAAVDEALAAEDIAIHGERAVTQDRKVDDWLWGVKSPRGKRLLWLDQAGRLHNPILDQMLAAGEAAPFLVVPILGQSTATQAEPAWAEHAFSNARVYQWNAAAGSIDLMPLSASWIGSGIGRELARQNPGARILIVPCGQGATGFTSTSINPPPAGYNYFAGGTWDRTLTADPNNLVVRAISRVNAALNAAKAQHPESKIIGWVWDQGQNDRALATYDQKLDDLIAYLRTQWGASTPVAIGGLIEEWAAEPDQNATAIMQKLRDTPRRVAYCAYDAAPLGSGDQTTSNIHATPWAAEEHGRILAGTLRRAMQATPAAPPTLVGGIRIRRSGTEAVVSWDAAPTRVTAYQLDYSTDSGATWQAAAIAEPVRTDLTLTGINATAPLWVRLRVVTPNGTSANTLTVKG